MTKKVYAFVGNWGFAPAPKGISTFQYDMETGAMDLIETIRPDIAAGQLCLDAENKILYAVNECGENRDKIGGGGYVLAFKINTDNGRLTLINEQRSLSPEPSYLCMTKSKKYIVACHCADPWHVTKIVRTPDGSYTNQVLFDDTALVLFPIENDGSIGKPCDVMITEGTGGHGLNSERNVDPVTNHIQLVEVISRLHAVIGSPDGKLFVSCDKGMDKLITFTIDETNGKFVKQGEYCVDEIASFPRYGVFHTSLPVFYANNENKAIVNCFHYNEDGKLKLMCKVSLLQEDVGLIDGKPVGAQDIQIHPNGKFLYVTLCGLNEIVVLSLNEEGYPTVIQRVSSHGNLPRGICFSPDAKYLISGNMVSGDLTTFEIANEGTLTYTGNKYDAVSPSAIKMLVVDESVK